MIEASILEKESPSSYLHVAVVGPEKNGKSVLFSTARKPALDLDYDKRRNALAGKKGVYALTLSDPKYPAIPTVMDDAGDIISSLERSLDLSEIVVGGKIQFPEVPKGTMLRSLAFDSISSKAKCAMSYVLYGNRDLRREVTVKDMIFYNPKGWDAWRSEQAAVEALIMRAFALPLDVYCMFHEVAEEAPGSTDEKPMYTGRISIYPARYRSILKYFNEVWRVKLEPVSDGNGLRYLPRVHPLPDYAFDAATTMRLDATEEPDIEKMIAKHEERAPKAVAGLLK